MKNGVLEYSNTPTQLFIIQKGQSAAFVRDTIMLISAGYDLPAFGVVARQEIFYIHSALPGNL